MAVDDPGDFDLDLKNRDRAVSNKVSNKEVT